MISGSSVLLKSKAKNPITILKNNGSEVSLRMEKECVVSSGDIIKLLQHQYHFVVEEDNSEGECPKEQRTAKTSSEEKTPLEDRKRMMERIQKLELTIDDLKSEVKNLKVTDNDLKTEVQKLQTKIDELKTDSANLKSENALMKSSIDSSRLRDDNVEQKSIGSNLLGATPKNPGFTNVIFLGYWEMELTSETVNRFLENNGELCKIDDAETNATYYANCNWTFSEKQWNAVQHITNGNGRTKIVIFIRMVIERNGSISLINDTQKKFLNEYTKRMNKFSFVVQLGKWNDSAHTFEDAKLVREWLTNEFAVPPQTSVLIVDTKDWKNEFFPETAKTRQQIKDFVESCPSM